MVSSLVSKENFSDLAERLPEKNKKDVEEIPEDVRDRMHIVFVKHADEVLKHALMK